MFSLFNFSSFFSRGVSWPHLPLCADAHGDWNEKKVEQLDIGEKIFQTASSRQIRTVCDAIKRQPRKFFRNFFYRQYHRVIGSWLAAVKLRPSTNRLRQIALRRCQSIASCDDLFPTWPRTQRRFLAWPSSSELSMGPFCVTQSNPTHQLTAPTQPNPLQVEKFGPNQGLF